MIVHCAKMKANKGGHLDCVWWCMVVSSLQLIFGDPVDRHLVMEIGPIAPQGTWKLKSPRQFIVKISKGVMQQRSLSQALCSLPNKKGVWITFAKQYARGVSCVGAAPQRSLTMAACG
ncbi:hypothetical protein GQ44DRAFT_259130 [Phaeosphaeriaceae sp. PMI808]|nr:hypothetical protein GQ44DRAFT_259130 [Phaeosphaeriaceae sp. PMI808]